MIVLDASAIIALLHDEPGADIVEKELGAGEACCSAVNLAEVLTVLADEGRSPEEVAATIDLLITIYPFDEAHALEASRLRARTKRVGLSLGDRSCLALGRLLNAPVLTADRAWERLDLGVDLRLIH